MKKLSTTLFLFIILAVNVCGEQISKQQAKKIAAQFIKENFVGAAHSTRAAYNVLKEVKYTPYYYIFNIAQKKALS